MIGYNIISTGSKGNAVVINETVLIDCGVSFRALSNTYKNLQLVLLTHVHGDHFNRHTITRLAMERPALRFACRDWMAAPLIECGVSKSKIDLLNENEGICYGADGLSIETVNLTHDVPNCGWKIRLPDGEHVFYATDTNSVSGIEAKGYDLYMIEANYSEAEIVERIRRKQDAGENCYEWNVLKNHLSREKAEDWLYQNMGQNSKYIFLHKHNEK